MLNNIHERGLSKQHTSKVKKIPGETTEIMLEKLVNLLESKADELIVHAGTNDLPKNIYPLTCFMSLVSFDTPWYHQKTFDFLMFSGVSKETIGMKWVK